mmetsp:Transcript_82323/g.245505  ORF Transcript_82323/g.245505 Transcript_82323/m.245505 type:complete len:257 (+) Transcript_82323:56-826(+)
MAVAAVEPPVAHCGPAMAASQEEERPPGLVLEQHFAQLEEALAGGAWEVDGDDISLYVCDGQTPGEGPAGAVLVTQGDCGAEAELVHRFQGGDGARVDRLSTHLVCEALNPDSFGTFTVGLAYDEDFQEAALLAISLRRPRALLEEAAEGGKPKEPVAVELQLNGKVLEPDVGTLPVRLELDAELTWAGKQSSVKVWYRLNPEGGSSGPARSGEATASFYTTTVKYDRAQALCLRSTGATRVRLVSARCLAAGGGA